MSKLHELAEIGQSIWLDYIRRDMLDSGELSQLHQSGIRGVTSNPSIFEKAIAQSDDYDDALRMLVVDGKPPMEIYETLAIEDIRRAAGVFESLYRQTERRDGYVSLEANPNLAFDTEATIEEARRLFAAVDRPNVYIKVPATPEGIPAIEQLIGEGININVTLIFAREAYEAVAEAYLSGLEKLAENGGDLSKVSSVASFFVSRVDTKVDNALEGSGYEELMGKIGIANAKLAYQRFLEIFSGERWERLAEQGAMVQRPLWGSTSTKNPAYPDTMYVDELIGPYTVNTVPPRTLDAFLDHGTVARTLTVDVDEARAQITGLAAAGVNLEEVTDQLLQEGVEKFAVAFNNLLESIAAARARVLHDTRRWESSLGHDEDAVNAAVVALEANNILARMWEGDHTVWAEKDVEISNRLGWLRIAGAMEANVETLETLAENLSAEGYTDVLLLGMGGSSLAPELFARTFGTTPGYLDLHVLDSTDPGAVAAYRDALDPENTLFVVSSKSGGTVETISFFKFFYTWIADLLGEEAAGAHFVAITDPGSNLAQLGERYDFRAVFLNDPNIGGRYSALSYFGLVPAALLGIDVTEILQRAQAVNSPKTAKRAAWLGAVLGTLAREGRDKLTFITSPELDAFGDWVEQLIAESTGKQGTGILPIVGEPPLAPDAYGGDRLIIYMRLDQGTVYDEEVAAIAEAGHPVITIHILDRYDLAEQFMVWEVATAVAGHILGINPFNQPNVESAKVRAREMIATYQETGELPDQHLTLKDGKITVHEIALPANSAPGALQHFLEKVHQGTYIAVHAYIQPSAANSAALEHFRTYLREQSGAPVTVGYGPRFLHSTGQLHKGDGGNGLFIQITSEPLQDLPIPDTAGSSEASLTFGTLKMAQAQGDAQALREAGRQIIRFHLWGEASPLLPALQQ